MIAKGSTVRQKAPVIEGVITDAKLDVESGKINYHVEFKGADGEPSARWFAEDEIEESGGGKVGEQQTLTRADVGTLKL